MAGNSWIAQQREAAFRSELNDKSVWINVAAMLLSEGTPVQSCESLFNRVMYVRANQRQTLMQMITSGFYGPYNRGEFPKFIQQIRGSQATVDKLNAAIETVMAGSDTIHGYTDQGLPTDPNGQHQPQIRIGGNVFNDWGGGPYGHDGAATWRQNFEASAANALKEQPVTTFPPLQPTVQPPVPIVQPPVLQPIPAPAPPIDPYAPIVAMLKAVNRWPSAGEVHITTSPNVTVVLNGVVVQQGGQ